MVERMWNSITESRPTRRSELAAWYRTVLDEQQRSGLSIAEAALEVGVTATTLYQWKRRLPRSTTPPRQLAAGLVQVRVLPAEAPPGESCPALVLRLGRGRAIEVPSGFDPDELARLIEVAVAC